MDISQHYSGKWAAGRDIFHPDNWKDGDRRHGAPSLPAQPSLSSMLPTFGSDGSVDKVLYQNLVEMVPLVETLMDQQNIKSFPRHASVIYTPTPLRDIFPVRKTAESFLKGKRDSRRHSSVRKGEIKGSLLAINNTHQDALDADALSVSSTDTEAGANKVEFLHLQSQVEELEQKLVEKEIQLQHVNSAHHTQLVRLQASLNELQMQILRREQEIEKANSELSDKQHEVVELHSFLDKAELAAKESSVKMMEMQEALNGMQQHTASLLIRLKTILSSFNDDELKISARSNACEPDTGGYESTPSDFHNLETEVAETARRKYVAALIVAQRHPTAELLAMVAVLRRQLQTVLQFEIASL